MNGKCIEDTVVKQLLQLADWAPTHARTEPWQFFVYSGDSLKQFGMDHANLYWNNTAEEKRLQATFERLQHVGDKVSHMIIAVMKRGNNDKIPRLEEICAASAAVQNILLGATALGIASFWSTGGMVHSPAMKEFLGLKEEDAVLGMIYLGYTDEPAKDGIRNIPLDDKIKWF